MEIWHLTGDAPRSPHRVSRDQRVALYFGAWPIEPGQSVWVSYRIEHPPGRTHKGRASATWLRNEGANSYWRAQIGPFAGGDRVSYSVHGRSPVGQVSGPTASFRVGPKIYLAMLWHQHQPVYKGTSLSGQANHYSQPWVRLHAIRDYYSMAMLAAEYPGVHLTINLSASLLWQLEDYVNRGATDHALELTLKPAEKLTAVERQQVLSTCFDAHWQNQICPHRRYKDLFSQRQKGLAFAAQDLRDLQMWYSLAWFGKEFRDGPVRLATGALVSVHRLVEQEHGFSVADIEDMVAEQYKIMRAVIPIHSQLQERGQIEVSISPFYHPILPLLVDSNQATIDRPGTSYPPRFAHPEDAEAQVRLAAEFYKRCFGRPPRGMWPAEGAVGQSVISFFARHGVQWIATDRGVLARSGRWGYQVGDPDVLCQPYRAEEGEHAVSVFFRDTQLSDAIGFHLHSYADCERAAEDFVGQIKRRFAWQVLGDEDRVLSVILDGENAWGAFREDARPFLRGLYGLLQDDAEIQTVALAEYLEGNTLRDVAPHAVEAQTKVCNLFTGSWIDENASAPGVDLGTWVGEEEENRAWELLGRARDTMTRVGATPATAPMAFQSLYIAEGSDWFWWFGADQDSGDDAEFDCLFRTHLKDIYRALGVEPPVELDRHIVPKVIQRTFARQVACIQPGERLTIGTNCPGVLTWRMGASAPQMAEMIRAGGVMARVQRYHVPLGPFPAGVSEIRFCFDCSCPASTCQDDCFEPTEHVVRIA